MTAFETFLMDKGYKKFILNCKTMKFEPTDKHIISTMVNLDHTYVHENNKTFLKKIEDGVSVMDNINFSSAVRNKSIVFGLHEYKKPATLVYPRPRIKIKRIRDKKEVIENELYDDSMNVVLSMFSYDEIFKAMYNKKIIFEIDLTKE